MGNEPMDDKEFENLERLRRAPRVPPTPEQEQTEGFNDQYGFMAEIDTVMKIIRAELVSATMKFGPFASAHEAYGVITEEYDEFWDEVKANKLPGAYQRMRKEATQLSAMAARFLLDVHEDNQGKEIDD